MIWLDTETYNENPISIGTYRYAATCEVDIVSYALDDGPVEVWDTKATAMPESLAWMLYDLDDPITAHNAMFDRNVLRLGDLKIGIPIERWRCSMVRAMAHGLPGGLDKLGELLKIDQDKRKHKVGRELMMIFCKPRPKNSKLRRATRETHPEEWAKYLAYAGNDIEAMRAICAKLPRWNMCDTLPREGEEPTVGQRELMLWHRDQAVNDRGYRIDIDLAHAALRATDRAQAVLKTEVQAHTSYDREEGTGVSSALQRDNILRFALEEYGILLPDLQRATIERRLADPDIDEGLRELLRIRLEASTTSTSKYKTLVKAVSSDGRLRGTIQMNGAQRTRRAAGRTFQPQNLPSRGILPLEEIAPAIEALMADAADMVYDNVMLVTSSTIRGCILADEDKELFVSDLANIEGRVAAWLAGEDWKLKAFRDFDAGTGADLYKLAYANAFGISVEEVKKWQRQIGKVLELFMQYEGGVGAFITGAASYGIDLDEMAEGLQGRLPEDLVAEAESFMVWLADQGKGSYGLRPQTFVACDVLKRLWRQNHVAISSLWRDLKDTLIVAVRNPGVLYTLRKLKIKRTGAWLRVLMPSGRCLCYPFPEVDDSGQFSYMGIDQYTRKWKRINSYGGKVFENLSQSLSRDILYDAKPAIEDAGFLQVLEVHDELVTEGDPGLALADLNRLLATPPPYALDLPLAAGGFRGPRYRKE